MNCGVGMGGSTSGEQLTCPGNKNFACLLHPHVRRLVLQAKLTEHTKHYMNASCNVIYSPGGHPEGT